MKMDLVISASHTSALRSVVSCSAMGLFMEVVHTDKEAFYPRRQLRHNDVAFYANVSKSGFDDTPVLYFKVLYPERLSKEITFHHFQYAFFEYCRACNLPDPSMVHAVTQQAYLDYEYMAGPEPEWDEKGSHAA